MLGVPVKQKTVSWTGIVVLQFTANDVYCRASGNAALAIGKHEKPNTRRGGRLIGRLIGRCLLIR
jgi:hypothetical protein